MSWTMRSQPQTEQENRNQERAQHQQARLKQQTRRGERAEPQYGTDRDHARDRRAQRRLVRDATGKENHVDRPAGAEKRAEHAAHDADRNRPRGPERAPLPSAQETVGTVRGNESAQREQHRTGRQIHQQRDAEQDAHDHKWQQA